MIIRDGKEREWRDVQGKWHNITVYEEVLLSAALMHFQDKLTREKEKTKQTKRERKRD